MQCSKVLACLDVVYLAGFAKARGKPLERGVADATAYGFEYDDDECANFRWVA